MSKKTPTPKPETLDRIKRAVAAIAAGRNMTEASRLVGLTLGGLKWLKHNYAPLWLEELDNYGAAGLVAGPGPRPETRDKLAQAAAAVAAGASMAEAAKVVGWTPLKFRRFRGRHPGVWQELLDAALAIAGKAAEAVADRRASPVPDLLDDLAKLYLSGQTVKDAAEALGLTAKQAYHWVEDHRSQWNDTLDRIRAELEAMGYQTRGDVPAKVRERIVEATSMVAAGMRHEEIIEALDIAPNSIKHWQDRYPQCWKVELARAMKTAIVLVRRQAGTDAVLEDPEAFLRKALACNRWAEAEGQTVFSPGAEPTLSTFYETYYKPGRLSDAAESTRWRYEDSVRYWVMLTGDPPLVSIDNAMLCRYRECLRKLRGRTPVSRMSPNSVRTHLRHVQTLLDKAGAPSRWNRDGAGLIETVPWCKPPRAELNPPRIATPEELGAVYQAAVGMERPWLAGVKPPKWWRALLVVCFNTGLRKRSLLELRWAEVDLSRRILHLPARRLKSRRFEIIPLNAITIAHLVAIRTDRELVFEYPFCDHTFHRDFHKLQTLAGIPPKNHFGLHAIRKATATALWGVSPSAAQYALGHMDQQTTKLHYVLGDGLVAKALAELPQPPGFTDHGACHGNQGAGEPA